MVGRFSYMPKVYVSIDGKPYDRGLLVGSSAKKGGLYFNLKYVSIFIFFSEKLLKL